MTEGKIDFTGVTLASKAHHISVDMTTSWVYMSASTAGSKLIVFALDLFTNPTSLSSNTFALTSGSYVAYEPTLVASKLYVSSLSGGAQTSLAEFSVAGATMTLINMHSLSAPNSAYTSHQMTSYDDGTNQAIMMAGEAVGGATNTKGIIILRRSVNTGVTEGIIYQENLGDAL